MYVLYVYVYDDVCMYIFNMSETISRENTAIMCTFWYVSDLHLRLTEITLEAVWHYSLIVAALYSHD